MSTVADPHAETGHGHDADGHDTEHGAEHRPDSFYVKIAVVLAVITAVEILLSYSHVGVVFLPAMLLLMSIKFVMVVLFFMHLKFDSKWFNMAFWTGLILAILVYAGALSTFKFFVKS